MLMAFGFTFVLVDSTEFVKFLKSMIFKMLWFTVYWGYKINFYSVFIRFMHPHTNQISDKNDIVNYVNYQDKIYKTNLMEKVLLKC